MYLDTRYCLVFIQDIYIYVYIYIYIIFILFLKKIKSILILKKDRKIEHKQVKTNFY